MMLMSSAMSTIESCHNTALFGIFLETNKHQNLTRLKLLLGFSVGCMVALQSFFVLPLPADMEGRGGGLNVGLSSGSFQWTQPALMASRQLFYLIRSHHGPQVHNWSLLAGSCLQCSSRSQPGLPLLFIFLIKWN